MIASQSRNSEPQRWRDQSLSAKQVWLYFNETLAARLVQSALSKKTLTLYDLYYSLAKLRAKCEWVKKQDIPSLSGIEWYAAQETDGCIDENFGKFIALGLSSEPDVANPGIWGADTVELATLRIGNDFGGMIPRDRKIALSSMSCHYRLYHQPKNVLKEIEPYFQKILITDNLFLYLSYSAQIIHGLSNYVAMTRGNAAVTEQIIGNIFQEKFGCLFAHKINISLEFQDWISFYETPYEYTNYYVISVIAVILQSIPGTLVEDHDFLRKIPETMMLAPYSRENNEKRRDAWCGIKKIIKGLLMRVTVSDDLKNQLLFIMNSTLNFREPFIYLQHALNTVDINGHYDSAALAAVVSNMSDADKQYTKKIIEYGNHVEDEHCQNVGQEVSEEAKQLWYDLETYRRFLFQRLNANEFIVRLFDLMELKVNTTEPRDFKYYAYAMPNNHFIPDWIRTGWLTPDDLLKTPKHIVDLLSGQLAEASPGLLRRVNIAIFSGGLKVQDMGEMTLDQIAILSSPCAVYLYNSAQFIRSTDLMAEQVADIEKNILKLMDACIGDKPLPSSVQDQLSKLLLEYMFEEAVPLVKVLPEKHATQLTDRGFFSCLRRRKKAQAVVADVPRLGGL